MKRMLVLVNVVILLFSVGQLAYASEPAPAFITLTAAPSTSVAFPFGVGAAEAIMKVYPEFRITVNDQQGAVE